MWVYGSVTDCISPKLRPEMLSPEMLFTLSSRVTEVTDGSLKTLLGLMVKCSCCEVLLLSLTTA